MNPSKFPEQNCVFAENQEEYLPIPAHRFADSPLDYPPHQGRIGFCWKLSWRERFYVFFSGEIWQQVLTFHSPFQPQMLTVEKPEME